MNAVSANGPSSESLLLVSPRAGGTPWGRLPALRPPPKKSPPKKKGPPPLPARARNRGTPPPLPKAAFTPSDDDLTRRMPEKGFAPGPDDVTTRMPEKALAPSAGDVTTLMPRRSLFLLPPVKPPPRRASSLPPPPPSFPAPTLPAAPVSAPSERAKMSNSGITMIGAPRPAMRPPPPKAAFEPQSLVQVQIADPPRNAPTAPRIVFSDPRDPTMQLARLRLRNAPGAPGRAQVKPAWVAAAIAVGVFFGWFVAFVVCRPPEPIAEMPKAPAPTAPTASAPVAPPPPRTASIGPVMSESAQWEPPAPSPKPAPAPAPRVSVRPARTAEAPAISKALRSKDVGLSDNEKLAEAAAKLADQQLAQSL